MNRIFPILSLLLLISFYSRAQDIIYRVTADRLNVRETIDPTSKKIGFLPQNENVAVIDSTDSKYFKVKMTNGEGWVSKEYLVRISPVPAKPSALPIQKAEQKSAIDYSNIIFIGLVLSVMIVLVIVIVKFVPQNAFKIFSIAVILAVAYFFYLGFIVKKTVSGKYITDTDVQYQSFDFKSKDSVIIHDVYFDTLTTSAYTVDGDVIKFKQQENTFILLIRDDSTLVGEGFTKGIFKRN